MSYELRFQDGLFSLRSRSLPFLELYSVYRTIENLGYMDQAESRDWAGCRQMRLVIGVFNQSRPFVLTSRSRANISILDSNGIALFAGISRVNYLRLCCVLAATQLRTMALNPIMEPEDLPCSRKSDCLFCWQDSIYEYAHVFEQRNFCPGCSDFYHALGADSELLNLRGLLAALVAD